MFRKLINIPKTNYHGFSSISNAFNTNKYTNTNRKYAKEKLTGLFGINDLRYGAGLEVLQHKSQSECKTLLTEALSSMRCRKIVKVLDDISDSICQVADLSECMRLLHPDKNIRLLATNVSQNMSQVVETFNTNRELFNVIDKVMKNRSDVEPLDSIDLRVTKLLHQDFESSGIHLEENLRKKFVEETQRSIEIATIFHSGTESEVTLPSSFLSEEMQKKLNLQLNQQINISHPYTFSPDPYIRELGYRAYYSNNQNQEELLRCLAESRHNIAKYSGFNSFSERANKTMICETPDNVLNFLNKLSWALLPSAEQNRLEILKLKYGNKIPYEHINRADYLILPWDFPYFLHQLKQNTLSADYEQFSDYFSLGACMEGINRLFNAHFGLEMEVEECIPGELWHPDVFKISVSHKTSGHIGTVYCDLFARDNKPAIDCHYTIRAGRCLDGQEGFYQCPIVVLHSSLTPVSSDEPSLVLLNPPAVQTLFHEWGHAVHSLLARTRYQHVAGTRCSTDLAEAPSTLMESFALDPRVVSEYARHFKTNEKLPDNMTQLLGRQRYIGNPIELQATLLHSMFDQIIHSSDLPLSQKESSFVLDEILRSDSLVPGTCVFDSPSHAEQLFWPQRFSHVLNYGARFYAYLMSSCIAGYIWKNGFAKDPWSSTVGENYRSTILQHGGEFKPLDMITEFSKLDSKVTIDSLISDFVDDLQNNIK